MIEWIVTSSALILLVLLLRVLIKDRVSPRLRRASPSSPAPSAAGPCPPSGAPGFRRCSWSSPCAP